MEIALYGIYALVVFISEILLVRFPHSFDFWYVNNSCVNTVRQHFPWSILYVFYFNLQLNHSTTATFWGQKKVPVLERWPLWGGRGVIWRLFLYFPKVQPVYFAVAYDGFPIIM